MLIPALHITSSGIVNLFNIISTSEKKIASFTSILAVCSLNLKSGENIVHKASLVRRVVIGLVTLTELLAPQNHSAMASAVQYQFDSINNSIRPNY